MWFLKTAFRVEDVYVFVTESWLLSSLQIPNDREICVNVQFDREHYVGVVQAVPINVYDYYEPGQSDTST